MRKGNNTNNKTRIYLTTTNSKTNQNRKTLEIKQRGQKNPLNNCNLNKKKDTQTGPKTKVQEI